jgi:hypothetical protein
VGEKDDLIIYRLDELKEDIRKLDDNVNKVLEDHEQRIRALEMGRPRASNGERRKFWVSVIALAAAIVTVAAALAGR